MVDARCTAVQDDPAAFCMDWPVFDPGSGENRFKGRVFVLDAAGIRIVDEALDGPGEPAADRALRSIGWTRISEWQPDVFGRPAARVQAPVAGDQRSLPIQPIASLAEEAALHLG